MMTSDHVSCLAVVLKTTPYGESDLCVELFTAQVGRARVMARGALKSTRRYMGTLELGALIKVDYRPKLHSLPTLGPCDVVSSPWRARAELPRLATLYYLLELVARCAPLDDPDEGLFRSLVELLQLLEGPEGLSQLELLSWELALLERLGYHLRINRCPYTGLAPDALSLREGGALHSSAGRPCSRVPTSALRSLYRLQRRAPADQGVQLSTEELSALRAAFSSLWGELCGAPLKSYPFLSQVLSLGPPAPPPLSSPPFEAAQLAPPLSSSLPALGGLSACSPLALCLAFYLVCLLSLSCTELPQGATGSLSGDEELVVEELEALHRQSLGASAMSPVVKAQLKEQLKRSLELARLTTATTALNAQLSRLSSPFDPEELTPYINGLEREERGVALMLSSPTGQLSCALSPSELSAQVLRSLQSHEGQLPLENTQPRLWLRHSMSASLAPSSPAREGGLASSVARPLPPPPIRPLNTQGGDWVAVAGTEVIEALILEGPTPWLPSSSHLIGRCELGATLKALTRLNATRDRQPYPDLKLTLTQLGWLSREAPSSP